MRSFAKRALLWGAAGTVTAGAIASAGAVVAVGALVRRFRMADMHGKVVLITGGSRGLGFAIAQEFAALGCKIVICARNKAELERAETELRRNAVEVLGVECDVADQSQVDAMVSRANERFGQIDVLVNNAGIISVGPLESQTVEDFHEAMDVMFWGQVYTTLAVLPQMKQRRSGWIANVSSIGGQDQCSSSRTLQLR